MRTTNASGIATLRMTGPDVNSNDNWHLNMNARAASTLAFYPKAGGATGLVLKNDGAVGIGTTSPAKALHLKGDSSTNSAQMKIEGSADTSKMYLGVFSGTGYITAGGTYSSGWSADGTNAIANISLNTGNANSSIYFQTSASNGAGPTTQMVIDKSGNVGIGTSSPAKKLHVEGDGYFNGNIGIGTTSPATALHVNGNIAFGESGYYGGIAALDSDGVVIRKVFEGAPATNDKLRLVVNLEESNYSPNNITLDINPLSIETILSLNF